ncbi:hypothetical protein LIER_32603 [Lithospermum erythrorhizon]|uniref:Uncharacterized protein n=1 Tax=Lithospermum erythrorhizon TaxID=34254 RepID=A0AAV3RXQ5_LITER
MSSALRLSPRKPQPLKPLPPKPHPSMSSRQQRMPLPRMSHLPAMLLMRTARILAPLLRMADYMLSRPYHRHCPLPRPPSCTSRAMCMPPLASLPTVWPTIP